MSKRNMVKHMATAKDMVNVIDGRLYCQEVSSIITQPNRDTARNDNLSTGTGLMLPVTQGLKGL